MQACTGPIMYDTQRWEQRLGGGVGDMELRGMNSSHVQERRHIREIKDDIKGKGKIVFFTLKMVTEMERLEKREINPQLCEQKQEDKH